MEADNRPLTGFFSDGLMCLVGCHRFLKKRKQKKRNSGAADHANRVIATRFSTRSQMPANLFWTIFASLPPTPAHAIPTSSPLLTPRLHALPTAFTHSLLPSTCWVVLTTWFLTRSKNGPLPVIILSITSHQNAERRRKTKFLFHKFACADKTCLWTRCSFHTLSNLSSVRGHLIVSFRHGSQRGRQQLLPFTSSVLERGKQTGQLLQPYKACCIKTTRAYTVWLMSGEYIYWPSYFTRNCYQHTVHKPYSWFTEFILFGLAFAWYAWSVPSCHKA